MIVSALCFYIVFVRKMEKNVWLNVDFYNIEVLLSVMIAKSSLSYLREVTFCQSERREGRILKCAGNLNSLRQEGIKELVLLKTVAVPRCFIIKEETIYEGYFIKRKALMLFSGGEGECCQSQQ